ncbi:MAG: prolyl oligopeptidase family serine peptidase, partial [Actinomycetota bacterium]
VRDPSIYYHRVGDTQADDRLVFHNDDDPEPSYAAGVTEDDRYLILVEYLGTDRRNGLLYLDLEAHGPTITSDADLGAPVPTEAWVRLVDQGQAMHDVVHHDSADGDGAGAGAGADTASRFLVHTDRDAPNGRLMSIDLASPGVEDWTTVVAEGPDPLEWVAALDGELVTCHLVEASNHLTRWSVEGIERGAIDLPGLGTVTGLSGRFEQPEIYLGYQSFVEPPAVLRRRADQMEVWASADPPVDPASVVVERRRAVSSDGAEVGMFVIRLADTELPGPVELYGYGGFSINLTPTYSPARLAFLEAGGIVVVANLRGGTEQGETWHQQGMLANKQQVFDDLIACARQLVEDGLATPATIG